MNSIVTKSALAGSSALLGLVGDAFMFASTTFPATSNVIVNRSLLV